MRLSRFAAGVLALVLPAALAAAPPEPTLTVRLAPIDQLLGDFRHLATVAGQAEAGQQVEALVQAFGGSAGNLAGLDTKRPIGLYAALAEVPTESPVVLVVPVADEEAVLNLMKNQLGLDPKKDNDGAYSVAMPNVPLPAFFRFANKCAYLTVGTKANIAKTALVAPAELFRKGDGLLQLGLRLDRIPDGYRQIVLSQLELRMADIKDQKAPSETPAQAKLKGVILDYLAGLVKQLLTQTNELNLALTLDRDTGEVGLDANLNAKAASQFAKNLASLGQVASRFGGIDPKAAVRLSAALFLPTDVRTALAPVIDELLAQGVKEQSDESKRELMKKAFAAIGPALKAGDLDMGVALRGPDAAGKYTFAAGLKVKEARQLEQFVRDTVPLIPGAERDRAKLDTAKGDGYTLHELAIADQFDPNAKRLFGDSAIQIGFRDDSVVIAVGPEALAAAKELLTASAKTAAPLSAAIGFARVAELAEPKDPTRKVTKEVFRDTKGMSSSANGTLTGSDNGLSLKLRVPTLFVKWGMELDAANKKGAEK